MFKVSLPSRMCVFVGLLISCHTLQMNLQHLTPSQSSHEMQSQSHQMNVESQVEQLVVQIKRLGTVNDEGQYVVTFGTLFNDTHCANIFEALVGTLRAAKRKKIITFEGELLLQGVHDNVPITLLQGNDD